MPPGQPVPSLQSLLVIKVQDDAEYLRKGHDSGGKEVVSHGQKVLLTSCQASTDVGVR